MADPVTLSQIRLNMPVLSVFLKWGISIPMSQEELDRALRKAARLGDEQFVAYFIGKGADVNGREPVPKEWRDRDENYEAGTPLTANARQGYDQCTADWKKKVPAEVTKRLIEAGADVNAVDEDGKTALHYALEDCSCAYNYRPVQRGSRREWDALYHENYDIFHGRTRGVDHSLIALELIRNRADVNRLTPRGLSSLLVLMDGFYYSELIPVLLEYGADVNFRTEEGLTPLLVAARRRNATDISVLLEAGADVHVADKEGNTPLHLAISGREATAAGLLLNAGADPEKKNKKGETVFDRISDYKLFCLVKEMGYADRVSMHVLEHLFVDNLYWNRLDTLVMDDLLAHGVSIHLKVPTDEQPESALFCVLHLEPSAVSALIRRGIPVDVTDSHGRTPLMRAIEESQPLRMIHCLVDHGADPYHKDNQGRDAFACAGGNERVLEILRSEK